MNIGVQLYTVRDFLGNENEIRDTFRKIKSIGYDNIQTGGPFNSVSYKKFRELADEADLEICGSFDDFGLMYRDFEKAIERHNDLGVTIMGIGGHGTTVDGVWGYHSDEEVEDTLNKINTIADNIYPHGFRFMYHNHAHEFCRYGNKTILQHFIDNTPKEKVLFCLDTYWTQYGGGDVRQHIKMLKDRIEILHLKDFGKNNEKIFTAAIGDGNLNWDGIIEEAKESNVKYFVVEQDDCQGENPFEALKRSREYLEKFN